jgi:hypothetical protein
MKTMKTFLESLNAIRTQSLDSIYLSIKNKKIDIQKEQDIYDLPIVYTVSSHGYYMEFAIIAIDNETVYCTGKGEYEGDEETFSWEDVDTNNVAIIADLL